MSRAYVVKKLGVPRYVYNTRRSLMPRVQSSITSYSLHFASAAKEIRGKDAGTYQRHLYFQSKQMFLMKGASDT